MENNTTMAYLGRGGHLEYMAWNPKKIKEKQNVEGQTR